LSFETHLYIGNSSGHSVFVFVDLAGDDDSELLTNFIQFFPRRFGVQVLDENIGIFVVFHLVLLLANPYVSVSQQGVLKFGHSFVRLFLSEEGDIGEPFVSVVSLVENHLDLLRLETIPLKEVE